MVVGKIRFLPQLVTYSFLPLGCESLERGTRSFFPYYNLRGWGLLVESYLLKEDFGTRRFTVGCGTPVTCVAIQD